MLLTGKKPNGIQIAEVMPTAFYPILTPSDSNAIVAYLRTLKPVKNKVPDPIYKIALPHHVFPGAEKPYSQADLNDKLKRGFYLATIGHCMECHTPFGPAAAADFAELARQGRLRIPRSVGRSRSRATSPRARPPGIGDWTDAEIKTRDHPGQAQGRQPAQAGRWASITTPR